MHNISMLLALLQLSGVSAVGSLPTYERRDPDTGETLTCDMCPAGTSMAAHCTATAPTRCAPCRADHYTALPNYLPRCLYCSDLCYDNQEVETECSAVSNRVCRCKEGFYMTDGYCARHSQCEPGHGVRSKGTSQADTVCEKCSDGYFSSRSSALDLCVNHQQCARGEIELLPGSADRDAVCGTCGDVADGGETQRRFLSAFFSMHKVPCEKLTRFNLRHILKSRKKRCTSYRTVLRKRGPLLDTIRAWLTEASREELNNLPQMLRATNITSMARKLDKRLNEIQQHPNCSSNHNTTM